MRYWKKQTGTVGPGTAAVNVVSSIWVSKVEEVVEPAGKVHIKPEARLVARGLEQIKVVHFQGTFTAVKFTSIRTLLPPLAHLKSELHQKNVVASVL